MDLVQQMLMAREAIVKNAQIIQDAENAAGRLEAEYCEACYQLFCSLDLSEHTFSTKVRKDDRGYYVELDTEPIAVLAHDTFGYYTWSYEVIKKSGAVTIHYSCFRGFRITGAWQAVAAWAKEVNNFFNKIIPTILFYNVRENILRSGLWTKRCS